MILRHVHAGGTLRLAALARDAKVHHLIEPLAAQILSGDSVRDDFPERVRPPARGVFLLHRRLVGGAHRAVALAARAHAVAKLDRAREAAVAREIHDGRYLGRLVGAVEAQVPGEGEGVHDFSGVHPVLRVEEPLHLEERSIEFLAKKLGHPLASRKAVAVLPAHGAAVFEYEVGDLLGDGGHFPDLRILFEVDERAQVQQAHARVAVVGGGRIVFLHDGFEMPVIIQEMLGGHRAVLHEGAGLPVAPPSEQKAQARLAHVQAVLLVSGVVERDARVADVLGFQLVVQAADLLPGVIVVFGEKTQSSGKNPDRPPRNCP